MSNRQYTLVMIAITLLVIAAAALWLWRSQRQPAPRVTLPLFPIVLVHGILGFDRIGYGRLGFSYFRSTALALQKVGAHVYSPRLPALGSVPARAEALARYISALPHPKVNIVAHSMGGLDARWAVSKLGIAGRVACVVTVATPHRGSPLADSTGMGLIRKLASAVGVSFHALDWLTAAAAARINEEAPDHPDVVYGSVVSRAGRRLWLENPILFAPWLMLRRKHGDSDGLVPAESQRWGNVWLEVEHDHWGQVGWAWRSSHTLYLRILQELAVRGG